MLSVVPKFLTSCTGQHIKNNNKSFMVQIWIGGTLKSMFVYELYKDYMQPHTCEKVYPYCFLLPKV